MTRNRLDAAGDILMIMGVSVWVIYAACRWLLGWDVTVRQFLPVHLCGVVPGTLLRRRRWLTRLFGRGGP